MQTGNAFDLDLKSVTDSGEFSGYASVFNLEDRGGDVVLPGAFGQVEAGAVKMLRQHDTSEPVGVWTRLIEDRKGLLAEGRLILDTQKGRETYALLKAGAMNGLSIGFKTVSDRFDQKKRVRLIEKLELWEVSLVTFP